MSQWSKETIEETIKKVKERAAKDEPFRALCKTNMHAAIKEVSGKEVPASFKIQVVDPTGYHLIVNLPALEKFDGELSESELENVAGGSKEAIADLFTIKTGDDAKDALDRFGYM